MSLKQMCLAAVLVRTMEGQGDRGACLEAKPLHVALRHGHMGGCVGGVHVRVGVCVRVYVCITFPSVHMHVPTRVWGICTCVHTPLCKSVRENGGGCRQAGGFPQGPEHAQCHLLWTRRDVEPTAPSLWGTVLALFLGEP